jgi:hypothetical protein
VAEIFVHCPRTGTAVPTGLKTEWVVLHSLPRIAMPLRCPSCGQTHIWRPQDAWIVPAHEALLPDMAQRAGTADVEA